MKALRLHRWNVTPREAARIQLRLRNRFEPLDPFASDGHGYAHPRRFGIASHLGVVLDCPTIGCAKSVLVGAPEEPGKRPGSWAPLIDDGETIAAVLRTREGVKPVYVSQGHRVSLKTAIEFVRAVTDGFRIHQPTRVADHFVAQVKRIQMDKEQQGQPKGSRNKNGR